MQRILGPAVHRTGDRTKRFFMLQVMPARVMRLLSFGIEMTKSNSSNVTGSAANFSGLVLAESMHPRGNAWMFHFTHTYSMTAGPSVSTSSPSRASPSRWQRFPCAGCSWRAPQHRQRLSSTISPLTSSSERSRQAGANEHGSRRVSEGRRHRWVFHQPPMQRRAADDDGAPDSVIPKQFLVVTL